MGVVCTFTEVFDSGGCFKVGTVGRREPNTLRACLDLRLEAVEGKGVDRFDCRNSQLILALTLFCSLRRSVRKCGRVVPFVPLVRYSLSRRQVLTLTSLTRITIVGSTTMIRLALSHCRDRSKRLYGWSVV